jgi:hypothetical protein
MKDFTHPPITTERFRLKIHGRFYKPFSKGDYPLEPLQREYVERELKISLFQKHEFGSLLKFRVYIHDGMSQKFLPQFG